MRWFVLCVALLASACGKLSIDAEGKECPCPAERGLECDSLCKMCVPQGTTPGASCVSDGGCKLGFSNFRPMWVTPNSIDWGWVPDTKDKQSVFQSYRLEVTPTLPPGEMRVYDASTNPELAVFIQPNDDADITSSALLTDLEPEVQYSARLIVRDVTGCEYSEVAEAPQTHAQTSQVAIEIFGEGAFSGGTLGGSLVNEGCKTGGCFQMSTCAIPGGGTKCCDNLRLSELSIQATISAGQFEHAYLEFYARNDSTAPAYYSGVWLRVGTPDATDNRYLLEGWTLPATGEYRRLQFPLRELTRIDDMTKLDAEFLAANDIREFRWYTCLTSDASAWFDDVYIRW